MLFKKKVKENKYRLSSSALPPLPSGGMKDIKSSINKQEDLSTLPELPSMPELAPVFMPNFKTDFKDFKPAIKPEFKPQPMPEVKDFKFEVRETKEIDRPETSIGGFKFPLEREERKKMTMDVEEAPATFQKSSFQPSFQPSFKFSDMEPSNLFKEESSNEVSKKIEISDKPIYVKIDKFKDALNTFELVKKKVREIDALLKKIKDTRDKEQQELATWEQEISEIKDRINAVDTKLFSKLD